MAEVLIRCDAVPDHLLQLLRLREASLLLAGKDRLAVDSIEHASEATEEQFKAMHNKGIFLDPTLWTLQALHDIYIKPFNYSHEKLTLIENEVKQFMTLGKEKLQRATRAGVRLAAGSDMWALYPGKGRGEATKVIFEAMVDAGLSPLDTIRAATISAADLLG